MELPRNDGPPVLHAAPEGPCPICRDEGELATRCPICRAPDEFDRFGTSLAAALRDRFGAKEHAKHFAEKSAGLFDRMTIHDATVLGPSDSRRVEIKIFGEVKP